MDKKLMEKCLDLWKSCNTAISCINDIVEPRDMTYGQREILYNLLKGINRRSFRLCKILEEKRLKEDEKNEIKQEAE